MIRRRYRCANAALAAALRVSMNDLTDDQAVDPASGNAVLGGMAVTVEPVERDVGGPV